MQDKMEKIFSDGFCSRLKALRGEDTLAVFANKIGISLPTYQHYESGRRKPTVQFVMLLAAACGKTTDWILGLAEQNGERETPNRKSVLKKAEAIIECAEKMKDVLGTKIAELKEVL